MKDFRQLEYRVSQSRPVAIGAHLAKIARRKQQNCHRVLGFEDLNTELQAIEILELAAILQHARDTAGGFGKPIPPRLPSSMP